MANGLLRPWPKHSFGLTLILIMLCQASFAQGKDAVTGSALGVDAFSARINGETDIRVRSGGDLSDATFYNKAVELYQKGEYEEAAANYMRACNIFAKACTNLGFMFNNGQGVKKSHLLAAELYERGCNDGNALGCTNLGIMYWKDELRGDHKRAAELFDRACRGGDSAGCRGLGFLYEHGDVVAADKTRAAELYRLADRLARVHQIPFRLQDGMVLISPTLNGQTVVLIVDTAATRTTFSRQALPPTLSVNLTNDVLSTPIGDKKVGAMAFSWNLDGRVIQLTASVGDLSFELGAIGVFGADMLETFGSVRFDYDAMVLTLEER